MTLMQYLVIPGRCEQRSDTKCLQHLEAFDSVVSKRNGGGPMRE